MRHTKSERKRTAKEWQEQLDLDMEPDAKLMALLEELRDDVETGVAERGHAPTGSVEAWTPARIQDVLHDAALARSLGEMLGAARQASTLTLAEVGKRLGVSRGRVSQLEKPEANLEMKTLVTLADALGYDVIITLKPRSQGQAPLHAELRR